MEIRNMVDGKIVSINGRPVVEVVVEPTPTPNEEIKIEDNEIVDEEEEN